MSQQCGRCRGCGKIADSSDGEPWTDWEDLPPGSNLAVWTGIVKPIPCPSCNGTGKSMRVSLEEFHGAVESVARQVAAIAPPAAPDALGEAIELANGAYLDGFQRDRVLSLLHRARAAHAEAISAARAEVEGLKADVQKAARSRLPRAVAHAGPGPIPFDEGWWGKHGNHHADRCHILNCQGCGKSEMCDCGGDHVRDPEDEIRCAVDCGGCARIVALGMLAAYKDSATLMRDRDEARAERDAALARADRAERERDALRADLDQIEARVHSESGASTVERVLEVVGERDALDADAADLRASLAAAQEREGKMREALAERAVAVVDEYVENDAEAEELASRIRAALSPAVPKAAPRPGEVEHG